MSLNVPDATQLATENNNTDENEDIPTKIVDKRTKIQFTCGFRELSLSGRADVRAIKNFIGQIRPRRVAILESSSGPNTELLQSLISGVKEIGIDVFTVSALQSVDFQIREEKIKIIVPPNFLGDSLVPLRDSSEILQNSTSTDKLSGFSVSSLPTFKVLEVHNRVPDGMRMVKVLTDDNDEVSQSTITAPGIGILSIGEVMLDTLKQRLEISGVKVEYRLGTQGGMLLCDDIVVIKKQSDNNFSIEGVSSKTLQIARDTLYECYTFL
jgi:hypothetical protein